jgi:hypothetical protein
MSNLSDMNNSPNSSHMSVGSIRTLGALFQGGIVFVACILAWFMTEPFWRNMVFNARAIGMGVLFTLPMLGAFIWVIGSSSTRFNQMRRDFDLVIGLLRKLTIFDVLIVSLLAGVGEEALFRGVLQTILAGWAGPVTAVLVSSVLFGMVHFVSTTYALYASVIGFYLGSLYLGSGNIVVPMVAHFLYDFLAILYGINRFGSGDQV